MEVQRCYIPSGSGSSPLGSTKNISWVPFPSLGCNPSVYEIEGSVDEGCKALGTHHLNTRQQGSVGVSAAVFYYTKLGYIVLLPISEAQRYDLVVDKNGTLYRVEVKTSRTKAPSGKYIFQLATTGGNQSWNKTIKYLSSKDCDLVFLYAEDGSMWEYPIEELEGCRTKTPENSNKLQDFS